LQSLTRLDQLPFLAETELNKIDRSLPRVAIWLVPGQPERAVLQHLIAGLAARFSAPRFIPHVTVYSCRRSSLQKELAATVALARQSPPPVLCTEGLVFGDRLTRACVVRLGADPALHRLRKSLHESLPQTPEEGFEPHLSLLYQLLTTADRATLAEEIRLPFREIVFDQIWAVAIPETLDTTENLSGWQPLLSCRLDSGKKNDKIQAGAFEKKLFTGNEYRRQD
jgi:2'-5' RNA ligase